MLAANKSKGPKACTTCAKAKARCIPGPEGSLKCERCHRLSKVCVSQTPAPARVKRTPKLSKIAALEKRLEELSSQVSEGQQQQQQNQGPSPAETPSPKPDSLPNIQAGNDQWDFGHIFPSRPAAAVVACTAPTRNKIPRVEEIESGDGNDGGQGPRQGQRQRPWETVWPPPGEADALLKHYKSAHAELFPFVVVPERMSVAELRRHRPFLWKAIMMVSCFLDGARQVQLGEELLEDIGRGAIVEGLKSLDLLHGLQLVVAWYNYALKGTQLTNLLFLARSMCANLGLKEGGDLTPSTEKTAENLDHMRAYAGTYYLNTLVFTANKRPDVLMNTTYLETCCKALEARMEHPSDAYLVKLVRIQQLSQSISLTMALENISQHATNLPLTTVVRSFRDQLSSFSNTIGPNGTEDPNLRSHVLIAEVLLYEIALSDHHTTAAAASSYYLPLTDRLQLLWSCLRSLREYFTIRFSHREMERPRFLCLNASDFVFTIITGMKLMTLQLPGWNLAHVHSELAMCDVMDDQIRDLVLMIQRRQRGLLPREGPGAPREDPFVRLMRQLKTLRDLSKIELNRLVSDSAVVRVGNDAAAAADEALRADGAAQGIVSGVAGPGGTAATTMTAMMAEETGFGELGMDFWQSIGMDNVLTVIGDPSTILETPSGI